jgi:hypothetical protein
MADKSSQGKQSNHNTTSTGETSDAMAAAAAAAAGEKQHQKQPGERNASLLDALLTDSYTHNPAGGVSDAGPYPSSAAMGFDANLAATTLSMGNLELRPEDIHIANAQAFLMAQQQQQQQHLQQGQQGQQQQSQSLLQHFQQQQQQTAATAGGMGAGLPSALFSQSAGFLAAQQVCMYMCVYVCMCMYVFAIFTRACVPNARYEYPGRQCVYSAYSSLIPPTPTLMFYVSASLRACHVFPYFRHCGSNHASL